MVIEMKNAFNGLINRIYIAEEKLVNSKISQ